ncbi:MAG: hypothetical protein LC792_18075, partial [Actinobacteria bacterium]|nr:hypothetical protein [Actinomycetota bacterium]
ASTTAYGRFGLTGKEWRQAVTGAIILALSVSLIAGLCAYVITLEEAEHHFPSKRRQHLEALRTGLVAMVFFLVLTAVLAYVFSRMFGVESGPASAAGSIGRYDPSRTTIARRQAELYQSSHFHQPRSMARRQRESICRVVRVAPC